MDKRESVKVIEYIKQGIRTGELTCGAKLPTERQMAAELQMSRPSVRETLRSLEHMGLLESRQGSGNYLTAGIGKSLAQSLELILMMDANMYMDISQTRRAIEVYAFRLAVTCVTSEQLECLHGLLAKMDTKQIADAVFADRQFHDMIVEASGNHLMMQLIQALATACESSIELVLTRGSRQKREELFKLHTEIVDCLEKKELERGIRAIEKHYDLIDQIEQELSKKFN